LLSFASWLANEASSDTNTDTDSGMHFEVRYCVSYHHYTDHILMSAALAEMKTEPRLDMDKYD